MKICIIVNTSLPIGLIANTVAVLSTNVGAEHPEIIGKHILDANDMPHKGITTLVLTILGSDGDGLKKIFSLQHDPKFKEVTFLGFNTIAQSCKTYDEYEEKMKHVTTAELEFSGICVYGQDTLVRKIVGNLPLYK